MRTLYAIKHTSVRPNVQQQLNSTGQRTCRPNICERSLFSVICISSPISPLLQPFFEKIRSLYKIPSFLIESLQSHHEALYLHDGSSLRCICYCSARPSTDRYFPLFLLLLFHLTETSDVDVTDLVKQRQVVRPLLGLQISSARILAPLTYTWVLTYNNLLRPDRHHQALTGGDVHTQCTDIDGTFFTPDPPGRIDPMLKMEIGHCAVTAQCCYGFCSPGAHGGTCVLP